MRTHRRLLALVVAFQIAIGACAVPPRGEPDSGTGRSDSGDVIRTPDVVQNGTDASDGRDAGPPGEDVVVPLDGSGIYGDAEVSQDGCTAGTCTPRPDSCIAEDICNDGLDNNCDGRVDESCPCAPGDAQRCFLGPPGRRGVGVCADGNQLCEGTGEFGVWGPCQGGISPSAETCDNADNDCDGCADDGLCCNAQGTCSSGDDPRVPVGKPFATYTLNGSTFYPGAARAWEWRVEGGPCDRMLFASRSKVSYRLGGATTTEPRVTTQQTLTFNPTLSGDYTVRLRVTQLDGTIFECTFLVKIRSTGFRVELCWDRTGGTDLDLWVHNPRNMNDWVQGASTCYHGNCQNNGINGIDWGYMASAGGSCRTPVMGVCHNPRLDIDNVSEAGIPENINVDVPRDADAFRIAVNYYDGNNAVRPMVNVYCGGELRATYGGATIGGTMYGSAPVNNFDRAGGDESGSLWRVADVIMREPADTCRVVPLVRNNATSGYCVDTSTNRTFAGPCRRRP